MTHFESIAMKRLDTQATLPTRAHPEDAGMDLYSSEDAMLAPAHKAGNGRPVKTGIAMAIPQGYVGMIADRSSLGKKGIKVAGGIVDAGYRGEVQVLLWNLSHEEIVLKKGERIAQMLLIPIATPAIQEVSTLDETARGAGGFGSTGK